MDDFTSGESSDNDETMAVAAHHEETLRRRKRARLSLVGAFTRIQMELHLQRLILDFDFRGGSM
jgi:hypothetical protein